MAGKIKDRNFTEYSESPKVNGEPLLGTYAYDVKLPNGRPETSDVVGPRSVAAFVTWLHDYATEAEQTRAFTFTWRGLESVAAQKTRILYDTVVTIPGTTRTLDLMAVPVALACDAINAHEKSIAIMLAAGASVASADDDAADDDELDEDTERATRKNRAWNNARRFLLESGKALETPEGLKPNPNYTAPAVSGSSDADIEADGNIEPEKPRRGRPRKNG